MNTTSIQISSSPRILFTFSTSNTTQPAKMWPKISVSAAEGRWDELFFFFFFLRSWRGNPHQSSNMHDIICTKPNLWPNHLCVFLLSWDHLNTCAYKLITLITTVSLGINCHVRGQNTRAAWLVHTPLTILRAFLYTHYSSHICTLRVAKHLYFQRLTTTETCKLKLKLRTFLL